MAQRPPKENSLVSQMIQRTILVVLIVGFLGCTSNRSSQHAAWTAQPTPNYWDLETLWVFSLLDEHGQIKTVLTVRFTDIPADACASGDARELQIVHQEPPPHPAFLGEPAYWLEGRALTIDLTSNLCDAYTELRGELTETGFVGVRTTSGMIGSTEIGSVYGARIPNLQ